MAPPNNRFFVKATAVLHRALLRATGGRLGSRFGGAEILLLTTTGRKSGRERTVPLMFFRDGGDIVLVASNAGDDHHPGWFLNLMSDPQGSVEIRGEKHAVTARKATPEERTRLWPTVTGIYSGYDDYTHRTKREIPLAILSVNESGPSARR